MHQEYPTDPVVHNLYTLTMVLQGQYTLPPTLFDSFTVTLIQMPAQNLYLQISRVDPNVPRERLEDMVELIQRHTPLVELNYLVAMRYKMGTDFDSVVERYARITTI